MVEPVGPSFFSDLFFVHCPRCDACARVVKKSEALVKKERARLNPRRQMYGPRRLICTSCGYVSEWPGTALYGAEGRDWFFDQPLWLVAPCCGTTLWAFNDRHLDFLEKFVSAKLRQSTGDYVQALARKLPKWIQESNNRDEVLKCIEKLRHTIPS